MPFIPHTPESLVSRSDSKNPATTCKGITSSGRPCRRALAVSNGSSPSPSPRGKQGVLAVLPNLNRFGEDTAAAFFCWQHKDQAQNLVSRDAGADTMQIVGLQERTSVDTIAERLGLLDIEDRPMTKENRSRPNRKPVKKSTLPKEWQEITGPLISVPKDQVSKAKERQSPGKQKYCSKSKTQPSNITFALFCCGGSPDKELEQAPRIRQTEKLPQHQEMAKTVQLPTNSISRNSVSGSRPLAPSTPKVSRPSASPLTPTQPRRTNRSAPSNTHPPSPFHHISSSETSSLLSLIPPTLSPQITSLLLIELSKPISQYDNEPGYIYIFWLTPSTNPMPDTTLTSSLLAPPSTTQGPQAPGRPKPQSRTTSTMNDLLRSYSVRNSGATVATTDPPKILLKIGRASNIQRRLNEWTRQCGHLLSLVRYYPYHTGSPSSSATRTHTVSSSSLEPRKVPYVHRVERLIHIELGEQRVKKVCDGSGALGGGHGVDGDGARGGLGCGRIHKEWFEVEGTREGVREVDAVVRRWVAWGEGQQASSGLGVN
ncbi:MAG: hypothetical protein MMC33_003211 [Icmadophila ericetorum]|nr:hypothetical protein [Icmadophila ericetorum]